MELENLVLRDRYPNIPSFLESRRFPTTSETKNNFSINNRGINQTQYSFAAKNTKKDNDNVKASIINSNEESTHELMNNFLKMMLAQIKNQDPTNPMDNHQLSSQMAQMQVALGIEKLNNTVFNMGTLINSVQAVNLSNWTGRTVLIVGKPSVSFKGQTAYGFELPTGADKVKVTFIDEIGKMYTQEYKDVKPGAYKLDIKKAKTTPPIPLDSIEDKKDKYYKVSIEAKNDDESYPTVNALKAAKVENVFFSNGSVKLALGLDGSIHLKDVVLVE